MSTTLPPFEPTLTWLREALKAMGQAELADKVSSTWCWPEIARAATDWPADVVDRLTVALVASGEPDVCLRYCCRVQDRDEVWRVIVKRGEVRPCLDYCRYVKDRPEMQRVIVDSGNPWPCLDYCRYVKDRPEMQRVIVDSGNAQACLRYCCRVQYRPEMRAVWEGESA